MSENSLWDEKFDAKKLAREYANGPCRAGTERIECAGCLTDLVKLIDEAHAAGKREGIEAAAKLARGFGQSWHGPNGAKSYPYEEAIIALLQTEARAETGKGER